MNKPEYELEPLRTAVKQCDVNIATMQVGIDKEKTRKKELRVYIHQHEQYQEWLKHGDLVQQEFKNN